MVGAESVSIAGGSGREVLPGGAGRKWCCTGCQCASGAGRRGASGAGRSGAGGVRGGGGIGVDNVEKKLGRITNEGVRNVIFAVCYQYPQKHEQYSSKGLS